MKILAKSLTSLFCSTVAGIGVASLLLPQFSLAQTTPTTVNPLQDFDSEQNSDPFSRSDDGVGGMLDLLHRAQQGNIPSWSEYSSQQNQNLDAAAEKFRTQQLRRLQGQNQVQPNPAVKTPQSGN